MTRQMYGIDKEKRRRLTQCRDLIDLVDFMDPLDAEEG